MKSELSQQRLMEVLDYAPETGLFTWKARLKRATKIGDVAGRVKDSGYRIIGVDGHLYRAHRLAFLYVTGEFPSAFVDHINGLRDDNRFGNLREATSQENAQNLGLRPGNKSGFTGVHRHTQNGAWIAQIVVSGKRQHLGSFKTREEAHAAYLSAKAEQHAFQPVPRGL